MYLVAEQTLTMQPVALVLLVVYAGAALIMLPREIQFLAGVPSPAKGQFITQDILLQASILLVLLPSALSPKLTVTGITLVLAGFSVLWVVVIWMVAARRIYVNRLLEESRREGAELLAELNQRIREQQAHEEEPGE